MKKIILVALFVINLTQLFSQQKVSNDEVWKKVYTPPFKFDKEDRLIEKEKGEDVSELIEFRTTISKKIYYKVGTLEKVIVILEKYEIRDGEIVECNACNSILHIVKLNYDTIKKNWTLEKLIKNWEMGESLSAGYNIELKTINNKKLILFKFQDFRHGTLHNTNKLYDIETLKLLKENSWEGQN